MAGSPWHMLIQQLRHLTDPGSDGGLADTQLLERFVRHRDEAAFEVLLWRHGPMVLSTCRRLLTVAEDVEDVFQATFLVFVRKAGAIGRGDRVGSWLYKVAYRLALRARAAAADRTKHENQAVRSPAAPSACDLLWQEVRMLLDEEVARLPKKYRLAFVLCHLEGHTNEEAARSLGCPVGTIQSRLSWARQRLRKCLAQRGITLSTGMLGIVLAEKASAAALPRLLAKTTCKAALQFATDQAAGAGSARAAVLAKGVLRTMFLTRMRVTAGFVLAAVVLVGGGGIVAARVLATGPADTPKDVRLNPAVDLQRPSLIAVPSEVEGKLVVIGTEIKPGEKVAPDRIVTVKIEGKSKQYRRLREGDAVDEGQLLACVDDRLARDELAIRQAKVHGKQAELLAAQKTREEARARRDRIQQLQKGDALYEEQCRMAQLTLDRYEAEFDAKKSELEVAQLEYRRAQTVLGKYEIRSPERGVIKAILKHRGEAVRALETVVQLQPVEDP
jgi:RNA polymerase sigma factor (sigma-70 family)